MSKCSVVYLDVSSSADAPTDIQLLFDFGTETCERSWNIKIALLPCEASYLGITLNNQVIKFTSVLILYVNVS